MTLTYSKAQALKLLHYYHPLLVGKPLYPSKSISIEFLGLERSLGEFFQIFAYEVDPSGKEGKRTVHQVAKEQGHALPQEIVNYLSMCNNFE